MKTLFFKVGLPLHMKWEYIPKTTLFKLCFITKTRFSGKSRTPFLFLWLNLEASLLLQGMG